MSRPLLLVAGILILIGLVWIGQGSGVIGGSAMSGSWFWLAVGVVLLIVGLGSFCANGSGDQSPAFRDTPRKTPDSRALNSCDDSVFKVALRPQSSYSRTESSFGSGRLDCPRHVRMDFAVERISADGQRREDV